MKNVGFVALEAEVGCLATEQEHQGRGRFTFLVAPGPRFTSDHVYVIHILWLPNWNANFKGGFKKLCLSSGKKRRHFFRRAVEELVIPHRDCRCCVPKGNIRPET